jgi:hypothetical protein
MRVRVRAAAAGGLLLLAACTTASVPAPVPPAGGDVPVNGAWEGRYQGVMRLAGSSDMGCQKQIAVTDFYVTANRTSFGAFFGVIRANGDTIMEADGPVIEGRFDAGRFTGVMRRRGDGCVYDIAAARVGP